MKITLHPGVRAAYIRGISKFPGERELLIGAGQQICLDSITTGRPTVLNCSMFARNRIPDGNVKDPHNDYNDYNEYRQDVKKRSIKRSRRKSINTKDSHSRKPK